MTDIEIRNQQAVAIPDQQPAIGTDLEMWARQAVAASSYAAAVCSTAMAPAQYRGKPAEATAAILAGAELGFSPMASLRAFDNISGTPAPKARTQLAVVQRAGHEVEIVESTDQRAEVRGRRFGRGNWQTSVWDIPRAEKLAQYKSNPNYRTNRAQMLAARAISEVCRWIASDAIMGMPHSSEEIQDQPALAPSPASARRLTMADLDAEPEPEPDGTPQWLPADGEPMTDKQRAQMFALWNELGFKGDENRVTRLQVTAKILGLESLESSSDLDAVEANRVIAALIQKRDEKRDGGTQ
jgi:hypothetical protein